MEKSFERYFVLRFGFFCDSLQFFELNIRSLAEKRVVLCFKSAAQGFCFILLAWRVEWNIEIKQYSSSKDFRKLMNPPKTKTQNSLASLIIPLALFTMCLFFACFSSSPAFFFWIICVQNILLIIIVSLSCFSVLSISIFYSSDWSHISRPDVANSLPLTTCRYLLRHSWKRGLLQVQGDKFICF